MSSPREVGAGRSSAGAALVEPVASVAPVSVRGDVAAPAVTPDVAWHAIWTRSRFEPRVVSQLTAKGIETFLPTFPKISKWSDRTKRIDWPLFPGYCFARFEPDALSHVFRADGVVTVLSNGGRPVAIPAFEIDALQRMVTSGVSFDPCAGLEPGAPVRIKSGPLNGVIGRLVRRGSESQIVLAVELLNGGARMQLSAWDVEAL